MSTLIQNVTAVLPDGVLKNAVVVVSGGKIASVSTTAPADFKGEVIDGRGQVLMSGFVNAHTHIAMVLMRGYGDGHDLHDWLNNFIFPVEDKWDARAIRAATGLALAELIAAGVTCVADMYMLCDDIAQEVAASGINANLARGTTFFGDGFDWNTHAGCAETRALVDKWHGYDGGRILVDACMHAEYTSKPPLYEALARYAQDKNLGMHVHVSETKFEHEGCKDRYGMTPVQLLDRYGIWNTRAIAAHCTWVSDEDMEIMAARGVSAIHNPMSNLKLGSGIARVPDMLAAGVNVALGTDGVSSNNSHDMFETIKLAGILHKGARHDPMVISARDALEMATARGGAALGRKTGKIAVGYDADLILVDFERPGLMPCHDAVSNLVYAAHGSDVTMNMARGKVIYKNGTYFTLDIERVKQEVREYAMPKLFG